PAVPLVLVALDHGQPVARWQEGREFVPPVAGWHHPPPHEGFLLLDPIETAQRVEPGERDELLPVRGEGTGVSGPGRLADLPDGPASPCELAQTELVGRPEEERAGREEQQVTGLREVKEERLVRGTVQVPDLEPAPPAGREVTVVRGERHTRHLDLP